MRIDNHGYKIYDRNEIINLVQEWYEKHGKIVIRDLKHRNGLPSVTQVINTFGSFQKCIKEAGIPTDDKEHLFRREKLPDEEMLNRYKMFVEEHLKTHIYLPTNDEVDACEYVPNTCCYIKRFGSFEKINELIGYNQKEFNLKALENDMLFKYKRACNDFGHTLSSREITKLCKENNDYIYSTEAYLVHFGSIHNLQDICGLTKTIPGKGMSKDELIFKLRELGNKLGRRPVQTDLYLYPDMPSAAVYLSRFGSFKEALKEAGFSNIRILKTRSGVRLNSVYELKFAQVLESYQIVYENEVYYKDIIPNFTKRYRFDFVILINDTKYYVELFGIEGNEDYDNRKKEKIEICSQYNVPLIDLYQKDIYAKTNKEIYTNLINRIKLIEDLVA